MKFHINAEGVPGPCRAKEGNCPYGGKDGSENHYDTLTEAQDAANRANLKEHSLLPGIQNNVSKDSHKDNDVTENENSTENNSLPELEEKEEKMTWYIYSDGTHSSMPKEGQTPIGVSDDWSEAEAEKAKVNEKRYSIAKGIEHPMSENEMSLSEQQEYYLNQPEIAEGVKRGPHRAHVNKDTMKRFVSQYLGLKSANNINFDKASKDAFLNKEDVLIIGENERSSGFVGFLSPRKPHKGVVLRSVAVRGEEDRDKKDFQLPRVFEIEYLDDTGVKNKIREHEKRARNDSSGRGDRIYRHENAAEN